MRELVTLALAAAVSGCPTPPPPPPPPVDAGPRDAPAMDVPGLDAELDATATDDVPGLDAPALDGGIDGDAPDVGPVDAPDDAPKDTGLVDAELPDGAFAVCVDSRMCRAGFACEGGTCVDRRVHCGPIGDCPYGFFCDSTTGVEPYFCQRLLRPCSSSAECPVGVCGDLDGDGDSECAAPGTCDARADCSAGTTCESRPVEVFAECGSYGACASSADCGGRECVDLWGDGVRECVDAGGCRSTASCPGNGICATPPGGGAPTCLSRPLP